jgi:hypothetical protein
MNQPQLPSPGGRDRSQDPTDQGCTREDPRSQQSQPKRTRIPETEEILALLMQLNGLVTLGMVSPAQANVMQRNLRTILDVQRQKSRADSGGQSTQALADLCRTNPQLLNLLEPFLSDGQVEWLMKSMREAGNEQT